MSLSTRTVFPTVPPRIECAITARPMSNRHGFPVIGNEVGAAGRDPPGPCHCGRTQLVRAFSFATRTSPNSGADIGCCPVISSRSTTTLLCQFATVST